MQHILALLLIIVVLVGALRGVWADAWRVLWSAT